ncbi:MAG: UDP-N-acetylglucosamine 2-epimerase (non-hydrolyzing) [Azospirillaceae bacterium]
MTILGTRPEIIRLSRIIPALDEAAEHVLVHTGQNDHPTLNEVFFSDFGLRQPDRWLGIADRGLGRQLARLFDGVDAALTEFQPQRVLVLGDTNSALSVILAKRRGIPVLHMEAGNRCFDDRVPEEVNRRLIDQASDILMPYTERSRANLLREGIAGERIFVTGNPITEVLRQHQERIAAIDLAARHGVPAGGFILVTVHRAENVDLPDRLAGLFEGVARAADRIGVPALVSTHPRTRERLDLAGYAAPESVRLLEPLGFIDFVALERAARVVLTDSGTVQEECTILGVPAVTLRDVTERPETIECGANVLAGADPERIAALASRASTRKPNWRAPPEYGRTDVTDTVVNIAIGHHHGLMGVPDASA